MREFESARELMAHYRELHARTKAWAPRPPPPPPPPAPAPAPRWPAIRMTPIERIMRAVAEEFQMPLAVMRSDSRVDLVVTARHVAALLARELTSMSLHKIGLMIGHRDHSTVIYAVESISRKIDRDPMLAQKVQQLRRKLLEHDDKPWDRRSPEHDE